MALAADNGGARASMLDGGQLLEEVFDLIRRRLPHLRPDDPVRKEFAAVLPSVARDLGRPTVELVPDGRADV